MDWGTYASNSVVSGNSNGLLSLMDHYDKVKEFFGINLDAFITALLLTFPVEWAGKLCLVNMRLSEGILTGNKYTHR